ncbi:ABC transporter substrate-binding protein [Achromobacter sp. RTa]|uniref:Bug family tripartite tricarboxylate transporter substrate binding protein n=1 Tax=Achromobacter sp. RTa TaxID=1532557 RepID=UPI00050F07C8|nr:tripartite tricarboxylate transporter substrate binding protein [Achromobacter sp. RTa]KGD88059.1 ABC transporter substrate-binding protein [Achromobacter sp. RTa]
MIPHATRAPRRTTAAMAAALLLPLCAPGAHAEAPTPLNDYPRQAITLVSPFPPGGGNDGVARLLANELGRITGQSVVVENRSGAGGNMGTAAVARAKPDGYTLVLSQNSVMAVNPAIYKNTGFDALKDFAPVSQITSAPLALVVRKESPYRTLADYLNDAKARPGAVTYATPGNGTLSHLTGVLLARQKNLSLVHVPYRGAGPAVNDLLGGTVDMLITSPPSVESLVTGGKLRVLGVTHESRIGAFETAPTLAGQGIEGVSIEGWYGVFAPAGTPVERIGYLASAISQAARTPAVLEKIRQDGAEVVASQPDAFSRKLRDETTYWAGVVKSAKLAVD